MFKSPRVSVVGGNVFSKVGGMQLAVRSMLEFLVEENRLDVAFLRLDNPQDIPEALKSHIRCFSGNTLKFLFAVFLHCLMRRKVFWVCDHINYAPLVAALSWGGRFCVIGYAYEFTLRVSYLKLWALRRARSIVCISSYTKKLCEKLGVGDRKLEICHLGVDFELSGDSMRRQKAHEILFVGRMDEAYKGQDHLIYAIAQLKERFPFIKLNLVGGGASLDYYKNLARAQGVENNVNVLGYVSDKALVGFYESASVFAMPSQCEGFGFVFVEAMAHGLPCVASNEDAAQEVVLHGETGYCIPYRDVDMLTGVLISLFEDDARREVMGARGRERYLDQFTRSAYKQRFIALIDRITSCAE